MKKHLVKRRFWLFSSLLVFASLLVSACSQVDSPNADNKTTALSNALITSLELAHGTTLDFIDLGEGQVGLGERTSGNTPPLAAAMLLGQEATPLEVFLSFAPKGAEAPAALKANHALSVAQKSRADATPQTRELPLTSLGLNSPSIPCTSKTWVSDWKSYITSPQYHKTAAFHVGKNRVSWHYLYPGSTSNTRTYLAACSSSYYNHTFKNTLEYQVQKKVGNSWGTRFKTTLFPTQSYTFYASTPSPTKFRARVRAPLGGYVNGDPDNYFPWRTYGTAAAWKPGLVFQNP